MNILVTGPGAIGCLFAGTLASAGHSVQMLDKDSARAGFLNEHGLTIKDGTDQTTHLDILTAASEADEPDFLCICVKSFDTAQAIRSSLSAITADTTIVSIQNGIGNAEIIEEITESKKVICTSTSQGATALNPGVIKHAGFGPTSVAAYAKESSAEAFRFAEILTSAGIDTCVRNDARSMLWSKLIISTAINPLTAISNVSNGELITNDELRETMNSVANEASAVARKMNIELDYEDAAEAAAAVCSATKDNISSMLQDVRAGKRTEIDAITGAVIRAAHEVGLKVPANEMLMAKISKLSARE